MKIIVCGANPGSLLNFRGTLIGALVSEGHEVYAAAGGASQEQIKGLNDLGAKYVDVPFDRTGSNPLFDVRTFWGVLKVIKSVGPDVALFYTAKPVIYGLIASWLCGVNRRYGMITGLGYAFSRSSFKSKAIELVIGFLYKFSLSRATGAIFQNPDDLELFKKRGLLTKSVPGYVVNGSGVNINKYAAKPVDTSKLSFLFVGRLLKAKGIRELCEAARLLKCNGFDAEIRIVGWHDHGNPDAILEKEFEQLCSQGNITFVGRLADVRPELEACSVFVLPSYREGTPRSGLEALSTGRAVITTNAPGCKEIVVENSNGFLVSVGDPKGLADRMIEFINNPHLVETFGGKSRLLAEQRYASDRVDQSIIDILLGD